MIVAVCVTAIFGFLTLCYVRNNTLEGNAAVKKSIAKHLFYLAVAAVLASIGNVMPGFFSAVRGTLVERIVVSIALGQYVLRVSTALIATATPVVTIIILKPMRPAMKQMFMKMFSKCKKNEATNVIDMTTAATNEGGPANEEGLLSEGGPANDRDLALGPNNEQGPVNKRGQVNTGGPVTERTHTDEGFPAAEGGLTEEGCLADEGGLTGNGGSTNEQDEAGPTGEQGCPNEGTRETSPTDDEGGGSETSEGEKV